MSVIEGSISAEILRAQDNEAKFDQLVGYVDFTLNLHKVEQ